MDTDDLIAAQIAYYRARAEEYDGELERAGQRPDQIDFMRRFNLDVAQLDDWLAEDPPTGHVLEIAAGSGNRTAELLRTADRVTALDAAPEMLALLRSKLPGVETIEADIFGWEPPQRYDNVFFGYWLTHVPSAVWAQFWVVVDRALAPGGRVWFMDNAHPDYANAHGPGDWPQAAGLRQDDATTEVQTRPLLDGTTYTMVKRYWWPGELAEDLGKLGWAAHVGHTTFAFLYGTAGRA